MKVEQSATNIDGQKFTTMKLYYCDLCTATFWTDGGLGQHHSFHFKKSVFDLENHRQELEEEHQQTEDRNQATNGESPQPNGEETEEKDDEPNEKDSKDITN